MIFRYPGRLAHSSRPFAAAGRFDVARHRNQLQAPCQLSEGRQKIFYPSDKQRLSKVARERH
jgi:hypothetical protein